MRQFNLFENPTFKVVGNKNQILLLNCARLAVAGAMGGVSVYAALVTVDFFTHMQNWNSVAMAAGAVLMTGAAKFLRVA